MAEIHAVAKDQPPVMPEAISTSGLAHAGSNWSEGSRKLKRKLTTRKGWLGDYDYTWLCMPSLPRMKTCRLPPFYPLDGDIPLLFAAACGLQQALSMLSGMIILPIIFSRSLNLDNEIQAYMASSTFISCGILSLLQMSRLHLYKGYYLGSGLLSMVGTGFATLNTATAIFDSLYKNGTCTSTTAADGTVIRDPCPDAYGKVLGTSLICSFVGMFMAFIPVRILRHIFPPMVTGTVILLIGASLIGDSGISNWGGGSNDCMSRPETGFFRLCPNIAAPKPLPWGSPEFIGLGFVSFISIVLTELFGSPFLKNISLIVGLAIGSIVAGASGYIDGSSIKSAPVVTFLWVHTFKIRVYVPAILPMIAVYISLAVEAIGDITASAEVSRVEIDGPVFESRIQGGLLSDGIGGFLSALFTIVPLTVFAQNNGVIVMTRCANRAAGRFCCFFLILFGVLGKVSGVFLAMLGGVTTFLFTSVMVSGVRILSYLRWTRRDRFILAAALSIGVGNLLVPDIFQHLFDGVQSPSTGLQGLFESITIVLSTPFLAAGIVAVILNMILPQENVTEPQEVDLDIEEIDHVAVIETNGKLMQ